MLTRYRLDPDPPEAIFKALCERPQVFEEFFAFRAIDDSKRRESRGCLTNRDRVRLDIHLRGLSQKTNRRLICYDVAPVDPKRLAQGPD